MKLSLKFPDVRERRHRHVAGDAHGHNQQQQQPILKAKVPITVFSQPFATAVTATTAVRSDLSLSLSTNFPSGPSLKVSYSPNAAPLSASPFSVTLKSGLGLFGSPKESPLTFSAHFSLSPSLNHPTPIFSLHFKPRIGHFSFHSSASSNPNPSQIPKFKPPFASDSALNGSFLKTETPDSEKHELKTIPHFNQASDHLGADANGGIGIGFKPAVASMSWEELKLEPCGGKDKVLTKPNPIGNLNFAESCNNRGDFFTGASFRARTALPIMKCLRLNFQWGLNLPADDAGFTMPYLTVQKIGIERDEEVKILKAQSGGHSRAGDSELLKGLCLWMRRDLEVMQRENAEMKQYLEEMRSGVGKRASVSMPSSENKVDFEMWRSKKNGKEENGTGYSRPANQLFDVESELRRAIKSSST
ncbi:uncharacterized protein LOC116206664 [Punica granatum]|uniref:Uncharacterized protein n=2 Tax=Punica granatum TaxID=22663 RepID=A0A218VUP2_PUNGR|nr:uncharacterized protein LOC116206664 [Punica granatum]OWM64106.1 hypothetical protein CDL15_Pgr018677 [Punica granatum]PKI57173.1 hypothetical protein CRG98_022463 [Punica granatum]